MMGWAVSKSGHKDKPFVVHDADAGLVAGYFPSKKRANETLTRLNVATELRSMVAAATPVGNWQGVLVTEEEWTGDDRYFEAGSLEWDENYLPFPLRWAPIDNGAHDGAVHVAWITDIKRQGNEIFGNGPVFHQQFMDYLNAAGKAGVSIDADQGTYTVEVVMPDIPMIGDETPQPGVEYGVPRDRARYKQARLRAATVVDIPAFVSSYVEPAGSDQGQVPAESAAVASLGSSEDATAAELPVSYAGIMLQAADTGRVLMLQRSLSDPEDPNAGLWEFPGGGLEQGEDPLAAASREFAEETGCPLPEDAAVCCTQDTDVYRLHHVTTANENGYDLSEHSTVNPDDPDGDYTEALAWWATEHIQGNHIRPEVLLAGLPHEGESMAAADAPVAPAPGPDKPAPPLLSPADQTYLEGLTAAHHDVQTLTAEFLQQADQSSPVADLANSVLEYIGECEQQVNELMGVAPEVPTEADVLVASAAPVAPPDEWFAPFDLDGPTPLTVTADGRVFGHLATWDSCHRSGQYAGTCAKPPSDPKAPFFQMGQVITASGDAIDVGVVTVGGGHASTNKNLTAALEHYDDVSTAAATVVVHEDEYGIGLFGSVVPDADPALVAALRRSPLSGDWRKEKGKWRLVAAHAVNTPGFPVPRGLVASVAPNAFLTHGRPEAKHAVTVDLRATARQLAKAAGLDNASLVASLRSQMSDLDCGCDDEEPALVASVSGDTSLPLASYDLSWDGGAAADRVFKHFTDGETVDTAGIGKAFLWRNEDRPIDQRGGWDLPFADIIDGELKIVPKGVQAAAGGHGVAQLGGASSEDKAAIKAKIGTLYGRIKKENPDAPDNPFG